MDKNQNLSATPEKVVTDDFTLTRTWIGHQFNNRGATDAVVVDISAMQPGDMITGYLEAAEELTFDPGENRHFITTAGAATDGQTITADAIGENITIRCNHNGDFQVLQSTGTWTVA